MAKHKLTPRMDMAMRFDRKLKLLSEKIDRDAQAISAQEILRNQNNLQEIIHLFNNRLF